MLEVIYVTRHGVSFSTHPRGSVAASCCVLDSGEATPGVRSLLVRSARSRRVTLPGG